MPDPRPASALLSPVEIEAVVAVLDAAWKREIANWWTVKRECAQSDHALADQGGCGCSYKDCYEHGKNHACSHGEPDWGPRAIEAVTRALAGSAQSDGVPGGG